MNKFIKNTKWTALLVSYTIGILLMCLDIGIKTIANRSLPFQESVKTPFPFLFWYLTHNKGYHYIFGKIPNFQIWAIVGSVVVILFIFSLSRTLLKEPKDSALRIFYAIFIVLIIGASGNVVENIINGYVTDFFIFRPFPWPSNISDQYINAFIYIALPIYLIKSFLEQRKRKKAKQQSASQQLD